MLKLYKILIGIKSKTDLDRYKLTLNEYNGLCWILSDLIEGRASATISSQEINFIKKYTKLNIEQRGNGWIISK